MFTPQITELDSVASRFAFIETTVLSLQSLYFSFFVKQPHLVTTMSTYCVAPTGRKRSSVCSANIFHLTVPLPVCCTKYAHVWSTKRTYILTHGATRNRHFAKSTHILFRPIQHTAQEKYTIQLINQSGTLEFQSE